MGKNKGIIEPIDASFEDLASNIIQPAGGKMNKNNELSHNKQNQPALGEQYVLDLGIETQKEINGIEMGILENGIPYLTQRGLAEISGLA